MTATEIRQESQESSLNPGKYESSPPYTKYFHNQVLEGHGEYINEFDTKIKITKEDTRIFPELESHKHVIVHEDYYGFVDSWAQ